MPKFNFDPKKVKLRKIKWSDAYTERVTEWSKIYGSPPPALQNQPCAKVGCKHPDAPTYRHHKGHEYLFASIRPETYAKRYMEFRDSDLAYVCRYHHRVIHKIYMPTIERYIDEAKFSDEASEKLRQKLIKMCDAFLRRNEHDTKRNRSGLRKNKRSRKGKHRD